MAQIPLDGLLQKATQFDLGSQLQAPGMVADLQAASMIGGAARQAAAAAAATVQPNEPLIQPTFSKAADSYGVMRHIDPVRDHFLNARVGIEALRRMALESVGSKSRSLLQRVEDYLKKHLPEAEYAALMEQLGIEKGAPTTLLKKALPTLGSKFRIPLREKPEAPNAVELVEVEHNTHSALFGAGAVVLTTLYLWLQLTPSAFFTGSLPWGGDSTAHVWGPAFMRDNLNAMAIKIGEIQARMLRLDSLGERLGGMVGIKPQEFKAAEKPGQGGPLVLPTQPFSAEELQRLTKRRTRSFRRLSRT
jgi:hypothetical protein